MAALGGKSNGSAGKYYSLSLLENADYPSDGFIPLGEEVRVVAETNDAEVFGVEFSWINPNESYQCPSLR